MESTLDWNWTANTKKKVKREIAPIGHDFEAVANTATRRIGHLSIK